MQNKLLLTGISLLILITLWLSCQASNNYPLEQQYEGTDVIPNGKILLYSTYYDSYLSKQGEEYFYLSYKSYDSFMMKNPEQATVLQTFKASTDKFFLMLYYNDWKANNAHFTSDLLETWQVREQLQENTFTLFNADQQKYLCGNVAISQPDNMEQCYWQAIKVE